MPLFYNLFPRGSEARKRHLRAEVFVVACVLVTYASTLAVISLFAVQQ